MTQRLVCASMVLLALAAVAGCKSGDIIPDTFGSLQGVILDFETGAPIPGAGVTTSPATDAVVTDASGSFSIADAVTGSYTITANRTGFTPNTATVSVREGRQTQATVFLRPSDDPDDGGTPAIDITAEVTGFFNRTISTTRGDSTIAVVDYRVRNTGDATVPGYQVIFRIQTPAGDFFAEVNRTALAVGQTAVGRVEKDTGGAVATAVLVDETFITGQTTPRPAR